MLMPNRTSNGRRYDCQLSLSNIGFGLLKHREMARSFSNDPFSLFFIAKE